MPEQKDQADEVFCTKEASYSHILVLMENINHASICWRDNTARHRQSRGFLEHVDNNLLQQVIEEALGWTFL